MSPLFIEGINAPDEIKSALKNLSKEYIINRENTKGCNGYLFFGTNRILVNDVAIKFYNWGGDTKYHAEPNTLAQIKSKNVLPILSAGLLNNEWAYFVTPYCSAGDLDDVLLKTKFGNIAAVNFTCQLLNGLSYLHEMRFLHRDLKPANIYVTDENQAVIGDFGSIKRLPMDRDSIPASSHSVLYTPPESIENREYGFLGDVYQCGIVLFQLLGGYLPYSTESWLNKKEKKTYYKITDGIDSYLYATKCLKTKIKKGKILDFNTLQPWVPDNLKRIIKKATNIDLTKRFQSASAFQIQLNNIKSSIPDWYIQDGCPVLNAMTQYMIIQKQSKIIVKKRRGHGNWRRDNSIQVNCMKDAVIEINNKVKS